MGQSAGTLHSPVCGTTDVLLPIVAPQTVVKTPDSQDIFRSLKAVYFRDS